MKVIIALVCVFVAAALAAPLLHSDSPLAVPNQYLVVLNTPISLVERDAHVSKLRESIEALSADAEVSGVFNIGDLIGYFARLTPELLEMLLKHEQVKYVEQDQVVSINYAIDAQEPEETMATITQTGATWGIDRVDQRNLPLNSQFIYDDRAGNGVDAYIIDTGILVSHTNFGGRATAVYNAITGESNTDLNGHGTHVAGTVGSTTYGIAKRASLYAVKVLSASGSGTNAGVVAGINYVTNNRSSSRRSTSNMSLGGGASATTDSAVTNSVNAGVIHVVAAGNDNANACNYSPARVAAAITVGATTNTDARSSFSNYGTCVNIFAPGSSITSTWIGSSNSATNSISGTSMASPHVAGVATLQASINPSITPANFPTFLYNAATPNVVGNPGTGSPNRLVYSPY